MRKDVEQLHSKFNMWRKEAEEQLSPTHTEQLTSLCDEVTKLLEQEYSFQAVHLADEIYGFAGDRGLELRVQLHRQYSKCDASNEEIFWSRWQLVDTLALLKHCRDAVEEQSGLYNWSRDHLMSDYVLQALYDSTQAQCWIATGRFDDWVALYFDALPLLKDSHTHRRTQCLFLRTGAEMFVQQNRLDDAYEQVVQLENINNEEPEWTDQLIFWCGITTTKLEIFRRQGQWTEYEKTAQPALVFLEQQFQALPEAPRDRNVICHIAHAN